MSILFIGKRFYTNRDAYIEKYGRIYKLPYYWSKDKDTLLWLIDYHSKDKVIDQDEKLKVKSTPIFSLFFIFSVLQTFFQRPKTIIASGDCYIGLLGFFLAKLTFSKFIFDVYDKYDSFAGYKNLLGINIYQFLLKKSDICFFASQKLLQDSALQCKKTLLVPNGLDENHFFPRDKIKSRKEFNLFQNDLYIGYFGSMEVERGVDDLIEAVKTIRNNGIDLKILLGGKKREDLNLDYNFIHYLGNVPFQQVPIAMACCDLLALPYRASEFLDNASSCKIAEYISMEIPIVATDNKNLRSNFHILTLVESDLLAISGEPMSLVKVILKQLNDQVDIMSSRSHLWKDISRIIF